MIQSMIFVTHDGLVSRFLNILGLWSTLQKVNWIMFSYVIVVHIPICIQTKYNRLIETIPTKSEITARLCLWADQVSFFEWKTFKDSQIDMLTRTCLLSRKFRYSFDDKNKEKHLICFSSDKKLSNKHQNKCLSITLEFPVNQSSHWPNRSFQ